MEQRNNLYYMKYIKIKERENVCVCHTVVQHILITVDDAVTSD